MDPKRKKDINLTGTNTNNTGTAAGHEEIDVTQGNVKTSASAKLSTG